MPAWVDYYSYCSKDKQKLFCFVFVRCPPGHGDIYPSLLGSGMLDKLIGDGIKYLFVSNSDNLGATLDLQLLQYFADSGKAFIMEVWGFIV